MLGIVGAHAAARAAVHAARGHGARSVCYRAWARSRWRAQYMAYSVLGGVEGDFGRITSHPLVQRIATAHHTGGANVALSWVAQLGVPLIVLSSNLAHLKDDLSLFSTPPWGRLTDAEMAQLSALKQPPGSAVALGRLCRCSDVIVAPA